MSRVAGVRLVTPADWWDLPLQRDTRDEEIGRMVERWATSSGVVADHRDDLTATLRTMAATAANAGAVLASSLSTGRPGRRLTANVVVALVDTGPRPLEEAVADLIGVAGMREVEPATLTRVSLGDAGTALRRQTRQVIRPPGATRDLEGVIVQFFVPQPGNPRVTAVVTFSAPATGATDTEHAVALFDDMARTFAFVDAEGEVVPGTAADPPA